MKRVTMQRPVWLLLFLVFAAAANVSIYRISIGLATGGMAQLGGWLFVTGQSLAGAGTLIWAVWGYWGEQGERYSRLLRLLACCGVLLALTGSWLVTHPTTLWGWIEALIPPTMMTLTWLIGGLMLIGGPAGLADQEE